jgi:hypothetical protein
MKKLNKSLLLLLSASALCFAACEKTDDPYKPAPATTSGTNTTTTGNTAYLNMKVNDTVYEAKTISYSTYYYNGLPITLLAATSNLPPQKSLTIKLPLKKGDYTIGYKEGMVYAKYGDYYSKSGSLKITAVDSINKRVSGNFSFVTDSSTITSGNFLNVPMR